MSRRFFVLGGDGGNEKYIKTIKVQAISKIGCNFAVEKHGYTDIRINE